MADDSQRAKARSTFGSSFFENSKAIPAPKNFAAAQQKTANSRPIPTFKVGGAVKKADGGMPRNRAMPYDRPDSMQRGMANGGLTDVRKSAVMQRAMGDQPGVPMTGMGTQPMKVMNHGGKVMKKAQGGTVKPAPNKSGGKKDAEYGDYVISGRPKMPPPKKAAPRPTMPPKTGDKRDAEYGDYVSGPRVIDPSVKENMKAVLTDIQNGNFAQRFMDDQLAGGPEFKALRAKGEKHPIEAVGRELRGLMSWVDNRGDDYVEGTAAR